MKRAEYYTYVHCSIIPESIKWQVANGQLEEAARTIKQIAAWNKDTFVQPTEADLQVHYQTAFFERFYSYVVLQLAQEAENERRDKEIGVFAVFKDPLVLRWLLIFCCCWLIQSLTYYTLSQAADALAGRLHYYTAFILLTIVEVPCVFLLTASFANSPHSRDHRLT